MLYVFEYSWQPSFFCSWVQNNAGFDYGGFSFAAVLRQTNHLSAYDCPIARGVGWLFFFAAFAKCQRMRTVSCCLVLCSGLSTCDAAAGLSAYCIVSVPFASHFGCCGWWSFVSKHLWKLQTAIWLFVFFSYSYPCHNLHLPDINVPSYLCSWKNNNSSVELLI